MCSVIPGIGGPCNSLLTARASLHGTLIMRIAGSLVQSSPGNFTLPPKGRTLLARNCAFKSMCLCSGGFPLQQSSVTFAPQHSGMYAACLTQGVPQFVNPPEYGQDITAKVLERWGASIQYDISGEGYAHNVSKRPVLLVPWGLSS